MKPTILAVCLVALLAGGLAGAQDRPGSIYYPDRGPVSPMADKTAARRGDILTVVIRETQNLSEEKATDLARATNLNYKLNLFDIKPNAFDVLPKLDADSSDGFIGSATENIRGDFQARLAVIVVDTQPGGNLVVAGRREIRIDGDTKLLEFTGIVRRYDVRPDNTVQSELVANAEITYRSNGPMSDSTRRYGPGAKMHRFLAWIWPF